MYALRFGSKLAQNFSRRCRESIDIFQLHLLDVFIPEKLTSPLAETLNSKSSFCAPKSGFISMRNNINSPENDVALLARASRYGSISHQHADQGNFALIVCNEPLINPTGYFGSQFGTEHHQLWTKQTKAHNCVLIDVQGQPSNSPHAIGKIVDFEDSGDVVKATLDLSCAYAINKLKTYRRTLCLHRKTNLITIDDHVVLHDAGTVQWLLHSNYPIENCDDAFVITGKKSRCKVDVSPFSCSKIESKFDPPCPGLPEQFHLECHYSSSLEHHIHAEIQVSLYETTNI